MKKLSNMGYIIIFDNQKHLNGKGGKDQVRHTFIKSIQRVRKSSEIFFNKNINAKMDFSRQTQVGLIKINDFGL